MLEIVHIEKRPPVIATGDVVDGRYRILDQVAAGGMGTVFLAEHNLIGRRFALKVLHPELASDTAMVQRFMNEALAAGTLGHPNIVESTDMGFTPERVPFIVFEYLEGALLSEEIARVGKLPVRRALDIARQIASALEAAHAAGIAHLDLKADNVLLTDRDGVPDHVKVLDFGISQFMAPEKRISQSVVLGTPEYMAPEQVTTPYDVDQRADIYSLGVLLYEMLAGAKPFPPSDPRILLYRIVHELPPELPSSVPPELARVVDKLLAKQPEERVQTMTALRELLDGIRPRVRAADSLQPVVQEPPRPTVYPVAPPQRSVLRIAAFTIALLAAAGGAALHLVEPPAPAPPPSTTDPTVLELGAQQIATMLANQARAARLRAEAITASPVLRAAIQTDAATLADLVHDEDLIATRPDETLEIFALREGARRELLLRLPTAAPAIPQATTPAIVAVGQGLLATAAVNVEADGKAIGVVTVAAPIDVSAVASALAGVWSARIVANGAALAELLPAAQPGGVAVEVPIVLDPTVRGPALTLAATLPPPPPPVANDETFRLAGQGALAAGGLLFLLAGISSVVARRRRAR